MRHTGRWFPIPVLLVLGVAAAWLFAAPSFEERQLEALADVDPAVRSATVDELVAGTTMSTLLYELGQDHASLVKTGLAEAARKKGVTSGEVAALKALLAANDPVSRHLAVGLLQPVASSAWSDLARLASDGEEATLVRAAAAAVLRGAGAQARGPLLELVRDGDLAPTIRYAALRSLAVVSAEGVKDVQKIAADTSRDWPERAQAIRALADPSAGGAEALLALLTSTEAVVRRDAVTALAARGDTAVATTLATMVIDGAADVRYAALQGLEVLRSVAAHRTQVITRLLDLDPRVQSQAARLVGQTCASIKTTVIPTLKGLLVSTNFRVRYETALALKALGDKSGAATMLADQATANVAQARMAAQAYKRITGV